MNAKTNNLRKYRDALAKGDREGVLTAVTADFGNKDNARAVLAYVASCAEFIRLENRVRVVVSFLAGVVATLIVGGIVRVFVP